MVETMTKRFKSMKASIVTGLVLVSIIVAVLPTASAGLIFNLQSVINVNWGAHELDKPVVPRGMLRTLTLEITHTVTHGLLGKGLLAGLAGAPVNINIEVIETPTWCTANLNVGSVVVQVKPSGESSKVNTTLTMQVADDAPALGLGYIKIRATAQKSGVFISGYQNDFTLSFIPDYKPLISPHLPEANTKDIGPMDTAVFPIEIENLGNARTIVFLNVTSVPKDWVAAVTSNIILEEGAGSKTTAYLTVRPPKSFGYHYDEVPIKISMQPVMADDTSKVGTIYYETFIVQSRGFSTPGFEAIAFIGAIAIVFLIVAYFRKRKI